MQLLAGALELLATPLMVNFQVVVAVVDTPIAVVPAPQEIQV